jgi:hypothetical protein
MTMMKHIYFASFTVYLQLTLVFFFAIDQASAVASQIVTTSGKLVGVNDGAGGKCLFQSNVRIMLINTSSDASSVISFKKVVSVFDRPLHVNVLLNNPISRMLIPQPVTNDGNLP